MHGFALFVAGIIVGILMMQPGASEIGAILAASTTIEN
jgi:hypothetical protein